MFLLIPYEIDAIQQHRPWANWAIIAVTVLISLAAMFGGLDDSIVNSMVLYGWNPVGLVGHTLLHGGLIHLAGNMVFLWVFGNALCSNMNNFLYLGLYVFLGLAAGVVHLLVDGAPAIGASGAINGIIGLAVAIYPRDEVDSFWLFFIRAGTFAVPVWVIVGIWLAFDIFGVVAGGTLVAYWAHLGGLAAGIAAGLVILHMGLVELTIYDKQTLLEFLKGEEPDGKL